MKAFKILLLILLVVLVGATLAQDEEAEACDYAALAARLTEVGEGLEASEDPAADLSSLQTEIATLKATCSGLAFTSEEYGMQPVIGPVMLPEGFYRLTVTSEGGYILEIEILEGDCDEDAPLILSTGEAQQGAQGIYEAEGECEVLLAVSSARESWELIFEKLR